MYLLDTNVISALRKTRPHGAVLAWIGGVADADLYISAVTVGEIEAGVEMTRTQDKVKAAGIEAWLDQVAATYNILPMDARRSRLGAVDVSAIRPTPGRRNDRGHGDGA